MFRPLAVSALLHPFVCLVEPQWRKNSPLWSEPQIEIHLGDDVSPPRRRLTGSSRTKDGALGSRIPLIREEALCPLQVALHRVQGLCSSSGSPRGGCRPAVRGSAGCAAAALGGAPEPGARAFVGWAATGTGCCAIRGPNCDPSAVTQPHCSVRAFSAVRPPARRAGLLAPKREPGQGGCQRGAEGLRRVDDRMSLRGRRDLDRSPGTQDPQVRVCNPNYRQDQRHGEQGRDRAEEEDPPTQGPSFEVVRHATSAHGERSREHDEGDQ